MLTISQLARSCAVSRTTVLYYEQAGLIAPTARSAAGYRLYSQEQAQRLRQIRAYRATGLSVAAITSLLDGAHQPALIAARLRDIQREMAQLREQQAVLVRLLGEGGAGSATMDKAGWTALFCAAGMDDAAMLRWHGLFEAQNPAGHQAFLESLGIDADETARIRAASRG